MNGSLATTSVLTCSEQKLTTNTDGNIASIPSNHKAANEDAYIQEHIYNIYIYIIYILYIYILYIIYIIYIYIFYILYIYYIILYICVCVCQ